MKKILFSAALAALVTGSACKKKSTAPVSSDPVAMRRAFVYFRDSATNALLIGTSGQRYHPDSIVVSGSPLIPRAEPGAGHAQVRDSAGKYGVMVLYFADFGYNADLTPANFDYTYYIRFSAADTDTLRFSKASGASLTQLTYNGRNAGTVPVNDTLPRVTILK